MRRTLYVMAACVLLAPLGGLVEALAGENAGRSPGILLTRGSALVPLRYISEWLGASVSFESRTGTISIGLGADAISLRLGSQQAVVNSSPVNLATAPMERSGVTYVPLRFVGEYLGAVVCWDAASKTVTVQHPRCGDRLVLSAKGPISGPRQSATGLRPQDGRWRGTGTADIRTIWFAVANHGRVVRSLRFSGSLHAVSGGQWRLKMFEGVPVPGEWVIIDGCFTVAKKMEAGVFGTVTGRFTSPTTAEGSISEYMVDLVNSEAATGKWSATVATDPMSAVRSPVPGAPSVPANPPSDVK